MNKKSQYEKNRWQLHQNLAYTQCTYTCTDGISALAKKVDITEKIYKTQHKIHYNSKRYQQILETKDFHRDGLSNGQGRHTPKMIRWLHNLFCCSSTFCYHLRIHSYQTATHGVLPSVQNSPSAIFCIQFSSLHAIILVTSASDYYYHCFYFFLNSIKKG